MTRTEPISYVEATIRALEEDNAELLAEIARLRAALERISKTYPADAHRLILSQREIINIARAALTAQPAAPGGDA